MRKKFLSSPWLLAFGIALLLCPSPPACAGEDEMKYFTSSPGSDEVPFFGEPVVLPGEDPAVRQTRHPKRQTLRTERRTDKFEIPANAVRNRDIGQIKGCWHERPHDLKKDVPGLQAAARIRGEYCLHGNGSLTYTITNLRTGEQCGANGRARFTADGQLVMDIPPFPCLDGRLNVYRKTLRCRGEEERTSCSSHEPDCKYCREWARTSLYR